MTSLFLTFPSGYSPSQFPPADARRKVFENVHDGNLVRLCDTIKAYERDTHLLLRRGALSYENWQQLFDSVSHNKHIVALSLFHMGLDNTHIDLLERFIHEPGSLKKLNLSTNHFYFCESSLKETAQKSGLQLFI